MSGKFVSEVSARVLGGRVSRNGGRWLPPKFVGKANLEGVWPCLDPMDSVCLRTASMEWNVPGKYGPHGELFFFLIQEEPATVPVSETFSPFFNADIGTSLFSADVLKKCALIALHVIAEEGRDGDGSHVPGFGDEWKMGCPKSPTWEGEGEAWSEDESVSCGALVKAMCATMRCTSSGCMCLVTRSLFSCRIGSWRSGIELSQGPGHAMQGNEWALLLKGPLSQQEKPFCHRGRAVTQKERDVVRENKGRRNVNGEPF